MGFVSGFFPVFFSFPVVLSVKNMYPRNKKVPS